MNKLKMQIDKIEKYKKKNIFNLYSDDTLLMSITEDTIVHFHLYKGKKVSPQELEEMYDYDQTMQCAQQAYRFLSRRAHLTRELQRKLQKKLYAPEIIKKTIQTLKDKNYLHDEDFVDMFIREEINIKRSGPILIQKKLLERGAVREMIDEKLGQLYNEPAQNQNVDALIRKKLKNIKEMDNTQLQKLQRFLMGKGYGWEMINSCLKRLSNQ